MLKNKKDMRTLFFIFLLTGVFTLHWFSDGINFWLLSAQCLLALSITSMVHNQVHVPMIKSKILNGIYEFWLTFFYGYPSYAWVPTHCKNHHVFGNRKGDFAPSYGLSEQNTLQTVLSYPSWSGWVQQKMNFLYIKKQWHKNRKESLYFASQFLFLVIAMVSFFIIDWKKALVLVVIPQQIALNMVLVFNYIQHIHCDEESKMNHSRNFLGRGLNFLLFNNGYHTVHHLRPTMHWSQLKQFHQSVETQIHPDCNETSLLGYFFRVYGLGLFSKKFSTTNHRALRMQKEAKEKMTSVTASESSSNQPVTSTLGGVRTGSTLSSSPSPSAG